MGDGRKAQKLLLGKPGGNLPRNRPKIRWEDNIILDLKEVDYEGEGKVLAQDRVTCSGCNEPSGCMMPVNELVK
mgnify:CR=1 FL=1